MNSLQTKTLTLVMGILAVLFIFLPASASADATLTTGTAVSGGTSLDFADTNNASHNLQIFPVTLPAGGGAPLPPASWTLVAVSDNSGAITPSGGCSSGNGYAGTTYNGMYLCTWPSELNIDLGAGNDTVSVVWTSSASPRYCGVVGARTTDYLNSTISLGAGVNSFSSNRNFGSATFTGDTNSSNAIAVRHLGTLGSMGNNDASCSGLGGASVLNLGNGTNSFTGWISDMTWASGTGTNSFTGKIFNATFDASASSNANLNINSGAVGGAIGNLGGGTAMDNSSFIGSPGSDNVVQSAYLSGDNAIENTSLQGNGGNDSFTLNYLSDNSSVDGGAADNTLDFSGAPGNQAILLGAGATSNIGAGGATTTLSGNFETTIGSDGNDTVDASASTVGVIVSSGAGDDTLTGSPQGDNLSGNDGEDFFNGFITGGIDTWDGGNNNDSMELYGYSPSNVTVIGGNGTDTVSYESAPSAVSITEDGQPNDGVVGGDDNIGSDVEVIVATSFDDVINLSGYNPLTFATAGENSYLLALSGLGVNCGSEFQAPPVDDTNYCLSLNWITAVKGLDGDDTITGSPYSDALLGGDSLNDTTFLGPPFNVYVQNDSDGNDTLNGGDGADYIVGGQGMIAPTSSNPANTDIVNAGDDNDTIFAAYGIGNTYNGGAGLDLLTYSNRVDDVTISSVSNSGAIGENGSITDTFSTIATGEGNDSVALENLDQVLNLYTNAGNDTITARNDFYKPAIIDCGADIDSASGYISNWTINCETNPNQQPSIAASFVSGPSEGSTITQNSASIGTTVTAEGTTWPLNDGSIVVNYLGTDFGNFGVGNCQVNSGTVASCDGVASAAGFSSSLSALSEGGHTFSLQPQYTNTFNFSTFSGSAINLNFNVDTVGPNIINLSGPATISQGDSASFTFGASESNSTFQCRMDSGAFQPCASGVSYTNLGVGTHTFRVVATDQFGNQGIEASYTFSLTSTPVTPPAPPVPPLGDPLITVDSHPASNTTSSSVTFTFSGLNVSTYKCQLDGQAFIACSSPISYNNLAPGDHKFALQGFRSDGKASNVAEEYWTVNIPQKCVLKTARARAFIYEKQNKVRLVTPYTAYKQAKKVTTTFSAKLKNGKTLKLGVTQTNFKKKGVYRVIQQQTPQVMKKLRKQVKFFVVKMQIPNTPNSCGRFLKKKLTIPVKINKAAKVWFQSDSQNVKK